MWYSDGSGSNPGGGSNTFWACDGQRRPSGFYPLDYAGSSPVTLSNCGTVAERPKAHGCYLCVSQGTGGSNPSRSANDKPVQGVDRS